MLKLEKSLSFQHARAEDIRTILAIYNASRQEAGCFKQPSVTLCEFQKLLEGEVVYVARLDEQPIGFVSVWVADHFIHHLYVLPEFQGNGIGGRLLEWCRRHHGKLLSLKCEVSNINAQRFYRNKGWLPMESGTGVDGAWERLYSPGE